MCTYMSLLVILFIVAPIVCVFLYLVLVFVVQNLVSFLVLQSSRWGRERERDGCLKIAFNVMGLLVLCVSSSRCNRLVCSV